MDYAEALLRHFVDSTKLIYGSHYLSHNIHNLLHLADDVRRHGCLDHFSNFSSENYLQQLKQLIRKPGNVLCQLFRRITEMNSLSRKANSVDQANFKLHHPCSAISYFNGECKNFFKTVVFKDFKLTAKKNDNCCALVSGQVIQVEGFSHSSLTNDFVVIGKPFCVVEDFYNIPCKSSKFNILFVKELGEVSYWPLKTIKFKLVKLPYKSGFVVLPLLHSEIFEKTCL